MKNPLDDHRFYRLLFPFRPPEFEFKGLDNPELINKLYQKYLKLLLKKKELQDMIFLSITTLWKLVFI